MTVDRHEPDTRPTTPRRLRHRKLLFALAAVVAVVGASLVAGTLYVNSIAMPDAVHLPESTTVYYNDGRTVLANLGAVNRHSLRGNENDAVKQAAVAARDPEFWTSAASNIARDYARIAYDLDSGGLAGKARLAVLTRKVEDNHSKDDILAYYLDAVAFGRGAYGIEAAARAYFGKSADKRRPAAEQINKAEAILLVALIAQPHPTPDQPGFDPTYSDAAKANAQARFDEIRDGMRKLGYLTDDEAAALTLPMPVKRATGPDVTQPVGLVIPHVLAELSTTDGSPLKGMDWQAIGEAGVTVVTTIDKRVQDQLYQTVDPRADGSVMKGQPSNLQAAAVVVQPGTGRVLGYYGGSSGIGGDYAGIYQMDRAECLKSGPDAVCYAGYGAHPAGAAFFPHTLAAALTDGISLKSTWDWSIHDLPGRTGSNRIRNSSRCTMIPNQPETKPCTLLSAATNGLNVAFFEVTLSVTPAKVLQAARDAGIDWMWTDQRNRVDLARTTDMNRVTPSKFDTVVGIGQYPVTVLDQANAMATYAAQGLRATAHFVQKVTSGNEGIFAESLPADARPILSAAASADLDYALSRNPAGRLPSRDSAVATGFWGLTHDQSRVAHAWTVGYTRDLAMAVWIGNAKNEQQLLDKDGRTIYGSGLPATIYRAVMTQAHAALGLKPRSFAQPVFAGRLDPAGSAPS